MKYKLPFGMGEIISGTQVKSFVYAGVSGGAALLAYRWGETKMTFLPDWAKPFVKIVVGMAAGRLLWNKQRDVSIGIAAVLSADALNGLAAKYIGIGTSAALPAGTSGLGRAPYVLPPPRPLAAIGDVNVASGTPVGFRGIGDPRADSVLNPGATVYGM
jgi:hypothetical protein